MLKISLLSLLRNTLSESPTIAYTLPSSIVLGAFIIIIKVARFPVNISILHGQKQLIKISSCIISQMCLYLIPPSPQFWSCDVLVWSILNIKCIYRHLQSLHSHYKLMTLPRQTENDPFLQCFLHWVLTSLLCHIPSGPTLTVQFITAKTPTYRSLKIDLHKRNKKTLYTTNLFLKIQK